MQNISFKSYIKPVTKEEFHKETVSINRNCDVVYPWTIKQSAIGKNVMTTDVYDCSACLVTDGDKAALMHLCPTMSKNHDTNKIIDFLKKNFDIRSKSLQGFVTGSKDFEKSQNIYNNFCNVLTGLQIPFSQFKTPPGDVHIAYKTSSDEILINTRTIDKVLKNGGSHQKAIQYSFDKVEIADCDEII